MKSSKNKYIVLALTLLMLTAGVIMVKNLNKLTIALPFLSCSVLIFYLLIWKSDKSKVILGLILILIAISYYFYLINNETFPH